MFMELMNPQDTIVAVATALGQGGVGIVRLSGPAAVEIADRMFVSKKGKKPSEFKSFMVHYGEVRRGAQMIDEALLTVMRAPRSYTKEDVVEISAHGGITALKAVVKEALDYGARLAEPGEFTKRAFLNGRMDLTQAEAVLDIIRSKTEEFLRVSTHQLKGELSAQLEKIRGRLMESYAEMEAVLNFPEDDFGAQVCAGSCAKRVAEVMKDVEDLLASSEYGRVLKEGMKIVICGRPNVGKSSLLNILLRQPRAIVSPVAGTTRDTIEETVNIKGIPFQLVDTAGILAPRDGIEEEAVRRSHSHMAGADFVLVMLDASVSWTLEDERLLNAVKDLNGLIVLNKCDLGQMLDERAFSGFSSQKRVVKISALHKTGLEELEEAVVRELWHGRMTDAQGPLISNLRHVKALRDCRQALEKAQEALGDGLSLEFVSEEIRCAVKSLDTITGRYIDEDLLESIFSQFCIGK